jgi:SAM-dependent methyltransferase
LAAAAAIQPTAPESKMESKQYIDVRAHNRAAWNQNVERGNRWTIPVSAADIARARQGKLNLLLTPTKPVPAHWYPSLPDLPVLCLASGGGQQGPLLAAAGARVTVFDNSPRQLGQDMLVAERENLSLKVVEGDATDLSKFADETFGLIFHPCSNSFMQNIRPIWRECFRVLRAGGVLLAGFTNPLRYIFDRDRMEVGSFEVRWSIPYSDLDGLSEADLKKTIIDKKEPFEFGHTLDDQIGGQLDSGFVLAAFYEDRYSDLDADPLSRYINTFLATRAIKPSSMAGSSSPSFQYELTCSDPPAEPEAK